VIDNARYLGVEHRHKEKEYGIKWRTAFKGELQTEYEMFLEKFGNPMPADAWEEPDHLEVIMAIINKDYKDMLTFAKSGQAELIEMLKPNLELYDKSCIHLRALLKRPELHIELAKEQAAREELERIQLKKEAEEKEAAKKKEEERVWMEAEKKREEEELQKLKEAEDKKKAEEEKKKKEEEEKKAAEAPAPDTKRSEPEVKADEKSAEKTDDKPADKPAEEPAKEAAKEDAEKPDEKAAEKPAETPAEAKKDA